MKGAAKTMGDLRLAIYDFDGTLYHGDALVDFWLFDLRRRPAALRHLPRQAGAVLMWRLGLISVEAAKEALLAPLCGMSGPQLAERVRWFWRETGLKRIPRWVPGALRQDRARGLTPLCISASPDFLLAGALSRLGFEHWICTETAFAKGVPKLHRRRGKRRLWILGLNCRGRQKPLRLLRWSRRERVRPDIEKVVSDRPEELILFPSARHTYLVRGGRPPLPVHPASLM